jgi:hypothetical protein
LILVLASWRMFGRSPDESGSSGGADGGPSGLACFQGLLSLFFHGTETSG